MAIKSDNDTSTVTYYPSFQALAAATQTDRGVSTNDPDKDAVEIRSALDYPAEPVAWLWPEKIPLGKVTLLIGDPGLGKSLIAIDVASRVSRGLAFPGSQPPARPGVCLDEPNGVARNSNGSHTNLAKHPHTATDPRQSRGLTDEHVHASAPLNPEPQNLTPSRSLPPAPGSVLILSAEDQIADTIRPRLDAHGADPAKIFFAPQLTDLRRDLNKLVATLDQLPDCRLIVVDPVNAYVGPSDSHFHTIVRKVLAPLAELAANRRIAILAVTHLRKNSGAAIARAAGSMGFVAAARSVWTVCRDNTGRDNTTCRDQENTGRNLLLPVKNNLGPLGAGLAYSIAPHPENGAAVIHWHAAPVTISAEDALTPTPKPRGPAAEERRHAGEWLERALADGPRESYLVLREGKQNGFGERTLQRALYMIGGQTRKQGYDNGWIWSLPPTDPDASPPAPHSTNIEAAVEKPVAFDETCRLRENHEKNEKSDPLSAPPPALAESIAFLNQLDAERKPPKPETESADANPDSPTGHPILDKFLAVLRSAQSPSKSESPPPTNNNGPRTTDHEHPRAKKSARSHSRLLREPTPGTSLAQRTTHDPERCTAATFPPT